jgi:hypothetical protein
MGLRRVDKLHSLTRACTQPTQKNSKLLSDMEKAMEAMQMQLAEAHTSLCASSAKITLLLETNAVVLSA